MRFCPPNVPNTTLPRVYSDGSYASRSGTAFGAVVYNAREVELAFVYGKTTPDRRGSQVAEYLGLLEGLKLACRLGLPAVAVFVDASEIRKAFNGPPWPAPNLPLIRAIVAEIQALPIEIGSLTA